MLDFDLNIILQRQPFLELNWLGRGLVLREGPVGEAVEGVEGAVLWVDELPFIRILE